MPAAYAQGQTQDQAQVQTQVQTPDQTHGQTQQDPPSRVARISFLQGSTSFEPNGTQDWVTADLNRSMTTGDRLWADKESRAELHVGSTAFRIDENSSINFLQLDDKVIQLQLSEGVAMVRLRHLDDDQTVEVDTPNIAVTLLQQGEYRIDTNEDGNESVVSVFNGRAQVTGAGSSWTIVADQQARFAGTDSLEYSLEDMPEADDFDQWCFSRDKREDHAASAQYVSPEVTGSEDLDDYGTWGVVPDYGAVWYPTGVAVGWAPYRYGSWSRVAPWGWTWIDTEPWGFAPFHYGRWAFYGERWCWVPGPIVPHPFWAPALVGFVGGGGFSLSVGVGAGIGWFPLAPGEVFVPSYRVSRDYVNRINITNTRVTQVNITKVYDNYNSHTTVKNITYANQRVANGVTVVSRDTFVNARPVDRNIAKVDEREIAKAPVSHIAEVAPGRASVVGESRAASVRPPAAVESRAVVVRHTPPAASPSFAEKQADLAKNPGRPLAPQQDSKLIRGNPPTRTVHTFTKPAPQVKPQSQSDMERENQTFREWQQRQTAPRGNPLPRQEEARPVESRPPQAHPAPSRPAFQNNHMPRPSGGGGHSSHH
jgi:hypothetical protein